MTTKNLALSIDDLDLLEGVIADWVINHARAIQIRTTNSKGDLSNYPDSAQLSEKDRVALIAWAAAALPGMEETHGYVEDLLRRVRELQS